MSFIFVDLDLHFLSILPCNFSGHENESSIRSRAVSIVKIKYMLLQDRSHVTKEVLVVCDAMDVCIASLHSTTTVQS